MAALTETQHDLGTEEQNEDDEFNSPSKSQIEDLKYRRKAFQK